MTRIHRGELPDRPAVKLWGLHPNQSFPHPSYEVVYKAAIDTTDLVVGSGSSFNIHWGMAASEITSGSEVPGRSEEWVDCIQEVRTPGGTLRSVYTRSTVGKPGYQKEHLLKEPGDLEKILSVPYKPYQFSAEAYLASEKSIGDRGITTFGLDHAMYAVERLIGSENFALWSIECRELLVEAISEYARRIAEHVKAAFAAGLKPIFAWVGPELCIPPLMSPKDFEDFVFRFDKPLCDLIHDGGGLVWVHCHGRMSPVLERFVEMGVDVLNPIEPPPMGDMTLEQAFAVVGDRMGLEGNIETHALMTATRERLVSMIEQAIVAGRGRRFILCPSSGYAEWPKPSERLISNLLTFVQEGVRLAEACRA